MSIADYASYFTSVLRASGRLQLYADQTYVLHSPILVPSGAVIEGHGYRSVLSCDGDFAAIRLVESDGTKPAHVRLRGFRATRTNTDGSAAGSQASSLGVEIWGDDVALDDLWLDEHFTAVAFTSDADHSSDVRIRGVRCSHAHPTADTSGYGILAQFVDGVTLDDFVSVGAFVADIATGASVTGAVQVATGAWP